jgi:hypothetical protein
MCLLYWQLKIIIVILIVLYGLVLSLLLTVILSLSKVKQRQRFNAKRSPGHLSCNMIYQLKYTAVLHSLTLWKVSTKLQYYLIACLNNNLRLLTKLFTFFLKPILKDLKTLILVLRFHLWFITGEERRGTLVCEHKKIHLKFWMELN